MHTWSGVYRAWRLRLPDVMRSSIKSRTATPVPLVSGMNIAKNESYWLTTVPTQYFSISASSVAPNESGNKTVARSIKPARSALMTPRGATASRLDADACPLSGNLLVMVIPFLFVRAVKRCTVSTFLWKCQSRKAFHAADLITQTGAALLSD